jgi:chromosome segregation ATPase
MNLRDNKHIYELLKQQNIIKVVGAVVLVVAVGAYLFSQDSQDKEVNLRLQDLMEKNDQYRADNQSMQAKLKAREEQYQQLNDAMAKLTEKLQRSELAAEAKREKLDMELYNSRSLKDQINQLIQDKDRLNDIIERSNREKEELIERNKEQNQIIKNTQDQLNAAQNLVKESNSKLEEALRQLKTTSDNYITAMNDMRLQKEQMTAVLTELTATKTELNSHKIDLANAQSELKMIKELQPLELQRARAQEEQKANVDIYKIMSVTGIVLIVGLIVFVVFVLQRTGADFTVWRSENRTDKI